jgi:hypothetical protein
MKRLILLFVAFLGLTGSVACADGTIDAKTDTPAPRPVFGVVKNYAFISSKIDSYCSIYSEKSLSAGEGVVITGIRRCEEKYLPSKDFYAVAYRGKSYFVDASYVTVEETETERLKAMSPEAADRYKNQALYATKKNWLDEVDSAVKELNKTKPYGVAILNASIYDISEYTEGTGFSITFYNTSKKTIKYLTTHFVGYNAVKDAVKDWRSKSKTLTLKAVGPIPPGTSASYSRDYAWMTDLVESFKITGLTIEYTDGTKKSINTPNKVWLSKNSFRILDEFNAERREGEETVTEDPAAAPAAK